MTEPPRAAFLLPGDGHGTPRRKHTNIVGRDGLEEKRLPCNDPPGLVDVNVRHLKRANS